MKFNLASPISSRLGAIVVWVGSLGFVLGFCLLFTGCSTVRTAWQGIAGTPVEHAEKAAARVDRAEDKVEAAKDALVDDAHTKVVLAELLSRYIAEQSKMADALRSTLSGAKADLDTARGALPPDHLGDLRQIVDQLRSDNAKTVAVAEKAIAALDTSSAAHAGLLTAALGEVATQRLRADKADAAALDWARERDAIARKWDRLWLWVYIALGAWLAAQLLPLIAKLIPAVAPAATAISAIAAPLSTYALGRARALAKDASAALHNVVTTVQAKAPLLGAEIEKIKGEWITPEDGTTTAYTAALREAQQL
jgi:hypothetical protein